MSVMDPFEVVPMLSVCTYLQLLITVLSIYLSSFIPPSISSITLTLSKSVSLSSSFSVASLCSFSTELYFSVLQSNLFHISSLSITQLSMTFAFLRTTNKCWIYSWERGDHYFFPTYKVSTTHHVCSFGCQFFHLTAAIHLSRLPLPAGNL